MTIFSGTGLFNVVIHICDYAWWLSTAGISKTVSMQMSFLPGHTIYHMELNFSEETEFSRSPKKQQTALFPTLLTWSFLSS